MCKPIKGAKSILLFYFTFFLNIKAKCLNFNFELWVFFLHNLFKRQPQTNTEIFLKKKD